MTDLRRAAQDALDALEHCERENRISYVNEIVDLRHALAQPDDGWIACETRMPEPGTRCMVYVANDRNSYVDVDEYVRYPRSGTENWLCFSKKDITHWRPLPPPPTTAQEDASHADPT